MSSQMETSTFDSTVANDLEPKDLNLTWKGLGRVRWGIGDGYVEFVCGNDVCRVHSHLAEFLSPKVAQLRTLDHSGSVFTFTTSESFEIFKSLVSSAQSGQPLRVTRSNFVALLHLSQELGNDELLLSLTEMIKTENLSLEKAIFLFQIGIDIGTPFDQLRDFIASRFYQIKKDILDSLDLQTAWALLSSPSLKIEDEDSLYDFVRSRSGMDESFASLFELIHFEYLSVDCMENFASFAKDNLLDNISSDLWMQICRRLILEVKLGQQKPSSRRVKTEFVYNGSPFEGIIEYLTRKCDGNVQDNINVTASSFQPTREPRNVIELETPSEFWSDHADQTQPILCLEFKNRSVIPTSYSLKSSTSFDSAWDHLKSWAIEVSKDGQNWTEIDRRENNSNLNGRSQTQNFKISRVPSESVRFIRLRPIGPDHCGYNYITLTALEIFGVLVEE